MRRAILLAAMAVIAAGAAHAGTCGLTYYPQPPAKYDAGPILFKAQVYIDRPEWPRMKAICGAFAHGCSNMPAQKGAACIIHIPRNFAHDSCQYREILRHEMGHCRGWPQNHPRR